MYVKRHYTLWMTLKWSRKPLIFGLIYSTAIIAIYEWTTIPFTLPWQPISVIGIAVAFYLGFKNNSSYDRTWEARKIWGAIVNDSRTFATAVLSLVETSEKSLDVARDLVYRHLAWLVALKAALRKPRTWEHNEDPAKLKFAPGFCKDFSRGLEPEISRYLSAEELGMVKSKSNLPSQLLNIQAKHLQELFKKGALSDYKHTWMHQLIGRHYDNQGRCERIKNFPFPRQYASTCLWINYIFCALIPFGLLDIFEQSTLLHAWLTIPFSSLIIWVFFLMDKIGDYSENPFEGAYNDVPISSITRAIEIDLLEMLDEKDIPPPYPVENNFLM
jgi:ion channel-forming bestrophin family protein